MRNVVDCWDIIARLRYDKSYWHHLEPAEITEIVQRIKEGKDKIHGLDKFIRIELRPASCKLKRMQSHLHSMHIYHLNMRKVSSF